VARPRAASAGLRARTPRAAAALALALALGLGTGVGLPGTAALALDLPLPPDGEAVVGRIRRVRATEADTLLDIARRFDLGYEEIVAANPGVDPWLPGAGTRVAVPTRFVLPPGPRIGMVINTAEMRLYFYPAPDTPWERRRVVTHPVGVGRVGLETPRGEFTVKDKVEGPSWTVPPELAAQFTAEGLAFEPVMPPGPDNPLGDYALILDKPGYAIHGTNHPWMIGMRVSHGCVRLYPEDISALFRRVPQGTPVRIVSLPYKVGRQDGVWYLEAMNLDTPEARVTGAALADLLRGVGLADLTAAAAVAGGVVTANRGVPTPITPRERPAGAAPPVAGPGDAPERD
jgi:L,D-transpeptidase ErfK/SrfK